MKITRLVEYRDESAKYDLSTAVSLFKIKRYPYVLFLGHLAIEKLLKAIYVKRMKEQAPYSHNLVHLVKRIEADFPEEILNLLADFTEFHIEARYPDIKRAFYKKCTLRYTKENLGKIRRVYRWLTNELRKS